MVNEASKTGHVGSATPLDTDHPVENENVTAPSGTPPSAVSTPSGFTTEASPTAPDAKFVRRTSVAGTLQGEPKPTEERGISGILKKLGIDLDTVKRAAERHHKNKYG